MYPPCPPSYPPSSDPSPLLTSLASPLPPLCLFQISRSQVGIHQFLFSDTPRERRRKTLCMLELLEQNHHPLTLLLLIYSSSSLPTAAPAALELFPGRQRRWALIRSLYLAPRGEAGVKLEVKVWHGGSSARPPWLLSLSFSPHHTSSSASPWVEAQPRSPIPMSLGSFLTSPTAPALMREMKEVQAGKGEPPTPAPLPTPPSFLLFLFPLFLPSLRSSSLFTSSASLSLALQLLHSSIQDLLFFRVCVCESVCVYLCVCTQGKEVPPW